jgi:ribosomal protein S27AE
MPLTIACLNCGVVLNLPENAEGRRLKCPKCGSRFKLEADGPKPIESNPAVPNQGLDGTILLDSKLSANEMSALRKAAGGDASAGSSLGPKQRSGVQPGPGPGGSRASSGDLPVMPTSAGDLRETFDLPMMTGSSPSGSGVAGRGSSGSRQSADALALFEGQPVRRKTAAEARAETRRCPTCGGVVAAGTSLCQTCGLDLETGTHIGFGDDLLPSTPTAVKTTPIPITIVGGACLAASVALTAFVLVKWAAGLPYAMYLLLLPLFGVYAAVRFLQGKSVRLLRAAVTVGALAAVVMLIAMPIYDANAEVPTVKVAKPGASPDDDEVEETIRPISERLDTQRLSTGIALLVIYFGVIFYLLTPQVNRHFKK